MGRAMRLSKQKDGEDGKEFGFDLQVVPIGMDEDGDVIDSCVVVEADVPVRQLVKVRRRGAWEQTVEEVLQEFALVQTAGIEVTAVIEEAVRRRPPPEGRDTRKQHARRALNALCDEADAPYLIDGDCITIL